MTQIYKEHHISISQEHLQQYQAEGDAFLQQIMAGNKM